MTEDRLEVGAIFVALGSALLAVSVFLPWYALAITASGAAAAQQGLNSVAEQYGNSAFQALTRNLGNSFNSAVGRQVATLSAHDALKVISLVLLALAGITLISALLRLASASAPARGQLALVGAMSAVCVLLRMVAPPVPEEPFLSVSLSWGIWVALASSLTIIVGDLWPRPRSAIYPENSVVTRAMGWLGVSDPT